MIWVDGGRFSMGSDQHYPEEAPVRVVEVDGFWIDCTPVTNRDYARFTEETGYVTVAEIAPTAEMYPEADPAMLKAGSSLFIRPMAPVALHDPFQWWSFSFGTSWRHPHGPQSDYRTLLDHPVVHICHEDAEAFASWADKELPSEAEWEFAARGGAEGQAFAWGDELAPHGEMLANYWQGEFPHQNLLTDGYERTSPVRSYPPNAFGLYDMIGNVWEWTNDWYEENRPQKDKTEPCCVMSNPRGGSREASHDPNDPGHAFPRKVLKGGSHLCAENYCQRYRPAARYPQTVDSATSHIGFRCIKRVG